MTQRQATMAVASLVMLAKSLVCGQDPIRLLPNNYHLVFENSLVQVIKVKYAPHEKLQIHNHSDKPTVYVYLTDSGPVRFSHVEAHAFTLVRPPEKAGTFRVSPGRMEKHEVENLGDVQTGLTAATNDSGVIFLPDGCQLAISAYVKASTRPDSERDRVIARFARAAFDLSSSLV